jgi:hypothetical protein
MLSANRDATSVLTLWPALPLKGRGLSKGPVAYTGQLRGRLEYEDVLKARPSARAMQYVVL